jgi:hypothetical protein
MNCPPCPRCGRVDQVAKVAGIVARGTQHSYKSDWRTSSSLDEDNDVRLSFGYSDTSTIKQSTLTRQLAFPDDKGGAVWGLGLGILFLSLLFVLPAAIDGYDIAVTILSWAVTISIFLIPIGLSMRFGGRAEAKKVWDTLYYCFRDDVAYVPHDSTRCAPPSMLRAAILKY